MLSRLIENWLDIVYLGRDLGRGERGWLAGSWSMVVMMRRGVVVMVVV
jgi:hypothetical protein